MMERLRKRQGLLVPGLLLFVCILAYGLQVFHLGFYLDDWVILDAFNIKGPQGVIDYAYFGNRPLIFWIWLVGFKLFQSTPAGWQIWAVFWRWMTAVMIYQFLRLLWPKAARQVALAALIFAVYPLFRQQATALTYSFHWICFFLWALSIYWMILAVRQPKRFALWMAASLLAGSVQLISQEFYVGLELLRPVIFWIALQGLEPAWKARLKRTGAAWMPFLFVFALYLVWRIKLMPTPGADRNTPDILLGLLTSPLQSITTLVQMFFQDMVQIVLGIWYETYQPSQFTLKPAASLVAWVVAGLAAVGSFAFFKLFPAPAASYVESDESWYKTAVPFGFLATVAGFLPGWMIGRHIYDLTGIYNDRFGLAAMFGAAVLVVGLVELLLKTETYRLVLACLLIGLGTGQNFRYETNYRYSWEKQMRLAWQLKWRAPELAKPTTVFGEGSMASFIGGQVTSSIFSQMYGPVRDAHFMDYRYLDVTKVDPEAIYSSKEPLKFTLGYLDYTAPVENSIAIAFEPDQQQCLWLLGEDDKTNPYLSEDLAKAVALSNPNQALPDTARSLRADIFGAEPAHDWCYYYEKGDLAAQLKDWGQVTNLWQAAQQNGKHPRVGVEYGPFIEAYARSGYWETALELSRKAEFPRYEMRAYVCTTWARIAGATPDSPEKQKSLDTAAEDLLCRDELK